jgi:pyrroloquinoline-quinone synthase
VTQTILAVADVIEADGSAARLRAALMSQRDWLARRGYQIRVLPYGEVASGRAEPNTTAAILFFPHDHWQREVEGKIEGLYGMGRYGREIRRQLAETDAALGRTGLAVTYLNTPEAVAVTRDKREVKRRWLAAGVPTPAPVTADTPEALLAAIDYHECIYIKAPCASMGKGIIVLSKERWTTNFVFRDGSLMSPVPGDSQYRGPDSWSFADVEVGDRQFLEAILAVPGFLKERGFAKAVVGHARIELRVTVLGNRVIDTQTYLSAAGSATTVAAPDSGAPRLPAAALDLAHAAALRAAAALNLTYAVLDVVLDEDKSPRVLDAQAFPALGTPPVIFRQMLDQLISNLGPTSGPTATTVPRTTRGRTEGAQMQTLDEFFADLNRELKATKCVENDFFASFRTGDITVDDVKMFSDQYYLYIRTFPKILAGLCGRVEDEEVRRELAKTIVSELGGEGGQIHFKLYEQAIEPLGITVAGVNEVEYLPETVALVDGIRQLFLNDSVEAAVGGHYTIELSGLPMIKSLYEGFRAFKPSTVESLEYFYLHLLIEREHVEWIHAAVEHVASPSAREDIRRGAFTIANLLGEFWDALQRRLTFQAVAA